MTDEREFYRYFAIDYCATGKTDGRYCDMTRFCKCGMDGKLWEVK